MEASSGVSPPPSCWATADSYLVSTDWFGTDEQGVVMTSGINFVLAILAIGLFSTLSRNPTLARTVYPLRESQSTPFEPKLEAAGLEVNHAFHSHIRLALVT